MTGPADRQTPAPAPDWRRVGRGTVIPILLLVALLAFLGRMHIDLGTGYTAPRMVGDAAGGFVFYDSGAREAGFYVRPISEQGALGPRRWTHGVLASVALTSERLVALYADREDQRWFYSSYKRSTLERTWSGTFRDPELRLDHPRHIAAVQSAVYAFGLDRGGALRAARLTGEGALAPTPFALPGAVEVRKQGAEGEQPVAPPRTFTSVDVGDALVLFWRVLKPEGGDGEAAGKVFWTRFDPQQGFGELHTLPWDLAALSAAAPPGEPLLLFGVQRGAQDANIRIFAQHEAGFREVDRPIPYERKGLTGAAGAVSLATGTAGGTTFLFAQIGGTIRYVVREQDRWSEWRDVDTRPGEQMAFAYGWFGSFSLLSLMLAGLGVRALRRRRGGAARPTALADAQVAGVPTKGALVSRWEPLLPSPPER